MKKTMKSILGLLLFLAFLGAGAASALEFGGLGYEYIDPGECGLGSFSPEPQPRPFSPEFWYQPGPFGPDRQPRPFSPEPEYWERFQNADAEALKFVSIYRAIMDLKTNYETYPWLMWLNYERARKEILALQKEVQLLRKALGLLGKKNVENRSAASAGAWTGESNGEYYIAILLAGGQLSLLRVRPADGRATSEPIEMRNGKEESSNVWRGESNGGYYIVTLAGRRLSLERIHAAGGRVVSTPVEMTETKSRDNK